MNNEENMSAEKRVYSIAEIERAINILRNKEQADLVLGRRVRSLADVYGRMIYEKIDCVSRVDLTNDQCVFLDEAFDIQEGRGDKEEGKNVVM